MEFSVSVYLFNLLVKIFINFWIISLTLYGYTFLFMSVDFWFHFRFKRTLSFFLYIGLFF